MQNRRVAVVSGISGSLLWSSVCRLCKASYGCTTWEHVQTVALSWAADEGSSVLTVKTGPRLLR